MDNFPELQERVEIGGFTEVAADSEFFHSLAILFRVGGAHHDYWGLGAQGVVAQLAENLGPIYFRQVHIEEHDVGTIVFVDFRYELDSFSTVFHDMQIMLDTVFFERLLYEKDVTGVVLG